jgi:hypothetical protein
VLGPGASYHETGSKRAAQEQALADYLHALQSECRVVQLGRLDDDEARRRRVMRLEQVYISLNVERRAIQVDGNNDAAARLRRRPERPNHEERWLSVLACLCELGSIATATPAGSPAQRLMLLGAPGSGKSTLLNHLTLCLANAFLADRNHGDAVLWLERLPGWSRGPVLPIRIILRDFAAFRPLERAREGTLKHLLDFLKQSLGLDQRRAGADQGRAERRTSGAALRRLRRGGR